MADKITVEKRSWNMSRIRSSNTKPELAVRSLLFRNGFRFTVNGPSNKKLPGKPDIVLPKYKSVIFVHGCFWHGHENCKISRIPKTRTDWWNEKISKNQKRDKRVGGELKELGWIVLTIWECGTKRLDELEQYLPALIKNGLS
jgi:DNA mismatch endonuclease (patch repair protein)